MSVPTHKPNLRPAAPEWTCWLFTHTIHCDHPDDATGTPSLTANPVTAGELVAGRAE